MTDKSILHIKDFVDPPHEPDEGLVVSCRFEAGVTHGGDGVFISIDAGESQIGTHVMSFFRTVEFHHWLGRLLNEVMGTGWFLQSPPTLLHAQDYSSVTKEFDSE